MESWELLRATQRIYRMYKKTPSATNTWAVFSVKPFLNRAKALASECEWQCYTLAEWDLDRGASSPLPKRCLISAHPEGNMHPMHLFLAWLRASSQVERKGTPNTCLVFSTCLCCMQCGQESILQHPSGNSAERYHCTLIKILPCFSQVQNEQKNSVVMPSTFNWV